MQAAIEGPVCNGTQVIGWHTFESSRRLQRFYAQISGFAFNSTILWDPKRWHRPTLEPIRQLDTGNDGFQVVISCSIVSHYQFRSPDSMGTLAN